MADCTTPPAPSETATQWEVDAALDPICFRALEKKPEDRFATMFDMIHALRRFRASLVGS